MQYLKEIYRDLKWVLIFVLLFVLSPRLLNWFDPSAGTLDSGYLHAIMLGGLCFFFVFLLVWAALHMGFPQLWSYIERGREGQPSQFQLDWQGAPAAGRIAVLVVVICLLAFIAVASLSLAL